MQLRIVCYIVPFCVLLHHHQKLIALRIKILAILALLIPTNPRYIIRAVRVEETTRGKNLNQGNWYDYSQWFYCRSG